MDPLSFRFRYFLAILFVTVITAGVLRHVFHVYGGLSRDETLAGALMAHSGYHARNVLPMKNATAERPQLHDAAEETAPSW